MRNRKLKSDRSHHKLKSAAFFTALVGGAVAISWFSTPDQTFPLRPAFGTAESQHARQSADAKHAHLTEAGLPEDADMSTALATRSSTEVLNAMMSCLIHQTCNRTFGQARQGELELRLLKALEMYSTELKSSPERNSEAFAIATYFIEHPLPEIKRAALRIFSRLPKTMETLHVLLNSTLQVDSAALMEEVLEELAQYESPSASEKIEEYLKDGLVRGSFVSAPTIARKISLFLTERNLAEYEKLLNRLPAKSRTHRNLKFALQSYKLTYGYGSGD